MKQHQTIKQSLLSQRDQSTAESTQTSYLNNLPVIDGENIFQRFLFTWLHPFLNYSSKQGVTVQSMPRLPEEYKTENQHERLMRVWQSIPQGSTEGWRLIKTIFLGYKGEIIGLLGFLIVATCLYITLPIMTSKNIDYIQNHRGDLSYGLTLFFLSIFLQIVNKIFFAQYLYRFSIIGIKWCNALNTMIYFKSLKYSTLANKKFSEAQIINYSQTDAQRMTYAGYQLSSTIYGPFQIIFALIMMYAYVGVSFLVGVSTIVLLIIANYFISKKANEYNEKALKAKDERMKVTEEMLDIIRFIKISAIQKFFFNKLQDKRKNELSLYLKKGLLFVITIFLFWISCPLLLSLTFITYVALGNQLSSQVAFTVMMLGNIIQYPIYSLPTAISQLIQVMVSIKRIQRFLQADDIKSDLVVMEQDSSYAIRVQNGNFFWQKEQKQDSKQTDKQASQKKKEKENQEISEQKLQEQQQKHKQNLQSIHVLKDINISIKKGKFVMVIGDIGSGKSSLLLAILNEMINDERSKVYLSGSIAYSAQKPWIMSKSVKENITFDSPYEMQKFKKVIYHSSFQHDLDILPNRQQTEIGEKGINISGGQKARLSLARALYSDKDIYFLDDILSAVDVHVGDFLMKQTLKGFLKGKTILMPTHALRYIEQADQIIVMSKGQIVQKGAYSQICNTAEFQEICSQQAEHQKQNNKQNNQQDAIDAELAMISEVMRHKTKSNEIQVQRKQANINEVLIEQLILPQDQQTGSINMKIFKQFIKNSGGLYKFVLPVVLSMTIWIISKTLSSVFIEKSCQNPSENNQDLYLFILFIMLSNVFVLIRATVMIFSSTKQGKIVHDKLIKSLLYASLSNFFNRVPMGRIVNRLTKDLRQIDEDIVDAIAWIIISFFQLLSTLVICIYASSVFAIIPMIIVGLLSNQARKYYMKSQREVSRYQKVTNSPVVSGFMSTIGGLASIRAYKAQRKFFEMQLQNTDQNKRVRLSKSGLQNWFCNVLALLSFLVNIPCIAYCMFSNTSNPSLVGLLMVYAAGLCQGMTNMTLSFAYFETKLVSMERIYTFMSIEPQKGYKQYCNQWSSEEEGAKQVFNEGCIEFQNLHARYRAGLPDILKRISCKIQGGEKIGIVGRTGAGKSTVINTFLKMTEISRGKLVIDGKDIDQYSLKDLRSSITMIDQEPTLLKSTFRQNLDLVGKYSDEQLEKILQQCNLYETIKEKGGIDASVSNTSLSAGEKQLLCICRAFLKNSRIVLIDEATANIDVKNDSIIQKVIAQKFKNSTVLTIAHRLSTIQNADKIMVLQKGQLIEFGRPSELEKKVGGFYSEMLKKNAVEMLS